MTETPNPEWLVVGAQCVVVNSHRREKSFSRAVVKRINPKTVVAEVARDNGPNYEVRVDRETLRGSSVAAGGYERHDWRVAQIDDPEVVELRCQSVYLASLKKLGAWVNKTAGTTGDSETLPREQCDAAQALLDMVFKAATLVDDARAARQTEK